MTLLFGKQRTENNVKIVTVRQADQDPATPDLLHLTKRPALAGWYVQLPDHYVGTQWVPGQTLVYSMDGLTLQEAKQFAVICLVHECRMEQAYLDPAFAALREKVWQRQGRPS
jgi:hypothetical protein